MKALSIQQPWAWLIVNGLKDIENRNWTTNYRGLVLIHTGKKPDARLLRKNGYLNRWYLGDSAYWQDALKNMPKETQDYETGGIVGYATLQKVVTASESPWFRGKYGFVLTQRHPVSFMPLRGQLGLFDVPKEIEDEINEIRDMRAIEAEAKDFNQIKREWLAYRLQGDETLPDRLT